MLTIERFIEMVKDMRRCQKAYFKHRLDRDLKASKRREREVDDVLGKLTAEPDLFAAPEELRPEAVDG